MANSFTVMLLFTMNVSAAVLGQNINLQVEDASLKDCIKVIEKQTDLGFLYNSRTVNKIKGLDFSLENTPVDSVLDIILEDTGLCYEIRNSVILIKEASVEVRGNDPDESVQSVQQKITVSGQITDEEGNPLPSATIIEESTMNGVISDEDGMYSIDVQSNQSVLLFSYVGYGSRKITVDSKSVIDVTLNAEMVQINEAVVVGYGTTKVRDLTGAVSRISESELQGKNVPSSAMLLQNLAAGVSVSGNTGKPGEEVRIRVRGATSLTGNNDPLYIVDGVPAPGSEVLNTIPPADIVSIDILKDASSSAIYGSRAANGVVMISTKSGHLNQKAQFTLNYNLSTDVQIKNFTLLDGDQFRAYVTDWANKTLVVDPGNTTAASIIDPESGYLGDANTDWFAEVKQPAQRQNFDLSVVGGSNNVTYFISGSVMNHKGMVIGDDMTRLAGRVNLDVYLSKKLKIGTKTTLTYIDQSNSGTSMFAAQGYRPDYPVYNDDETTYYGINPVANTNITDNSDSYGFTGILYGELEIINGLKYKTSVSASQNSAFGYTFNPSYLSSTYVATASRNESLTFSTVFDNTLTFSKIINNVHSIDAVGGVSFENYENSYSYLAKKGYALDEIYINVSSGNDFTSSSESKTGRGLFSSFARLNYKYNDKYLLTLTARYDGSSMFGKNNQFGFFPSAAVAWRINKESFLESAEFINDLRIKLSAGKTGVQNLSAYSNRDLYTATSYNGVAGIEHYQIGNKDIKWETTSIYDAGVDFAFFKYRLSGSLGYYLKNTDGLIWSLSFPSSMAVNSMNYNIGSVRNSGIELTVKGNIINRSDFSFDLGLNLATNHNEVTSLVEEGSLDNSSGVIVQGSYSQVLAVGYPMGVFLGYKYNGIIQNQARIDELNAQAVANGFYTYNGTLFPGNLEIADLDGNGTITTKDQTIIGNPQPDLFGGISASARYGKFSLQTNFGFQIGGDKLYGKALQNLPAQLAGLVDYNLYNRWSLDNTSGTIPAMYIGQGVPVATDYSLYDASYFRLQDIRISYDLPEIKGFALKGQIYVTATNLFTITSYPGTDPATVNTYSNYGGNYETSYPGIRTFSFGIKLGL